MGLVKTAGPTEETVELSEVKEWLGLRHDELDLTVVLPLIEDATAFVEERVRIQIGPATWQLTLDEFPNGCEADDREIILERPPVRSVTVDYVDADGNAQTLDPANYQLDTTVQPARIVPAPGTTWPSTQYGNIAAVTVTIEAGAVETASVDRNAKRAVLLLVGFWFYNRDSVGKVGDEIAPAFEAALNNLRWTR